MRICENAVRLEDGRFTYRRRDDEIAAEARLDDIYVIRTSLPKEKIGAQAAVAAYKSLALVERAFRTLKGANLGTLTLNGVALPLGQGRTIHMLARPTALQEQAFALLSVPLPCVQ